MASFSNMLILIPVLLVIDWHKRKEAPGFGSRRNIGYSQRPLFFDVM